MNNEKENQPLIIVVVILIILILSLSLYIIYDDIKSNKKINDNNDVIIEVDDDKKLQQNVSKINTNRALVYEAEYQADVEEDSYVTYDGKEISVDDIKVPYINIDSNYADKINTEIYHLYESIIDAYKNDLEYKVGYTDISYDCYNNDDILSIYIKTSIYGTSIPVDTYYTYNISLTDGNKVSYEDIYMKLGYTENTIKNEIEIILSDYIHKYGDWHYPTGTNYQFSYYYDESISNYNTSVKLNTIKYYLDGVGLLNVVLNPELPLQMSGGEKLFKIE